MMGSGEMPAQSLGSLVSQNQPLHITQQEKEIAIFDSVWTFIKS
jgi:hypothetical protein